MSDGAFRRGDVVWHLAPFQAPPNERPLLVISDEAYPFHGEEYAVGGLTRTHREKAVELATHA